MRTFSTAQEDILQSVKYDVHLRVEAESSSGLYQDLSSLGGSDWVQGAKWDWTLDRPVPEMLVSLRRDQGPATTGESLAPLDEASTLNTIPSSSNYTPFLDVGRGFRVYTAVTGPGVAVGATSNYEQIFDGEIDDLDWAKSALRVRGRSKISGALADRWIESSSGKYGSQAGVAIETVMQNILDDYVSDLNITLWTPTSPGFLIAPEYQPDKQPVMKALTQLSQLIGWDVREQWSSASTSFRLKFYEPDRDPSTTDFVFGPDNYLDVHQMSISREDVRNSISIIFGPTSSRQQVVAESTVSQDNYGRRWMEIEEASNSAIQSTAEADTLAQAALKDLQDPPAVHEIELPYWWPAEIQDYYGFSPNDIHYDTLQEYGLYGVSHELSLKKHRTRLKVRGKPAGQYRQWLAYTGGGGGLATLDLAVKKWGFRPVPTTDANRQDWELDYNLEYSSDAKSFTITTSFIDAGSSGEPLPQTTLINYNVNLPDGQKVYSGTLLDDASSAGGVPQKFSVLFEADTDGVGVDDNGIIGDAFIQTNVLGSYDGLTFLPWTDYDGSDGSGISLPSAKGVRLPSNMTSVGSEVGIMAADGPSSSSKQYPGTKLYAGSTNVQFLASTQGDGVEIKVDIPAGGASTLGGLSDVTLGSLVAGEYLRYNGSNWEDSVIQAADLPANGYALGDLSDVVITGAATGEYLRYNGANWVDDTIQLGDLPAIAINDLSDVTITSATAQDHLEWSGSAWVNVTDITMPTGGQIFVDPGDSANLSIAVTGDTNTGMYFNADEGVLRAGSQTAMTWSDSGVNGTRVGIVPGLSSHKLQDDTGGFATTLLFQAIGTNQPASLALRPSGTSNLSRVVLYNDSDSANDGYGYIDVFQGTLTINGSAGSGTGTAVDRIVIGNQITNMDVPAGTGTTDLGLGFTGMGNTGFYQVTGDSLGIVSGGSLAMRIGMGTTTAQEFQTATQNGTAANPSRTYINDPDSGYYYSSGLQTSFGSVNRSSITSTQTLIRKTDGTVLFTFDDTYVETDQTFRPQSVGDLDLGSSSLYWQTIYSEWHDWFITTTPVAPASGFGRMWYEGVGVLKVRDSGGTTYTFDATAGTGFTTAGAGLEDAGSNTVAVEYDNVAGNLIDAANSGTIDSADLVLFEDNDLGGVKSASVSSLLAVSHTHPASDITEGTFGAGAYTFTRTTADTTPTVRIENTSGTTGRVLLTLDGESDELRFENYGTGDWQIVNSQQTNGIRIKDGSGGITFLYNNAEVVAIDSSGGLDTLSGGILTGGTQRIQQDGDLVNIKDITATGAFTTTGVGPHGIGSNGSTNIQLLIDGAFTAIGGASASGIRYNSDITGVAGNTVRLTHFDMSSPTITTQSVNETVDDIASFRIVKPTITNNLFNAGLGEAITSATNGTVTTTGAHGFSTSDIVHINGNTDSNHNGWWTITNTGSNTFTLDEYTGTSSGTGGDAYPASKITKAATLWIPNEPTAGTATGIDEAWGIYAPVSARLGNVTAGLIEPISDSTYALGTAINRWSTVYADSLDVGTFLAGDGAESAPSYAFSDDSNTGMWSPVNDTIAFSTGGTERFRVASGSVEAFNAILVTRSAGNSTMTRFRREDNTDLAWDQRIDNPGGTYEIRSVTDAGATVLNALQLEHATGDLTLKGWIRSEDGSAGSPTYSFSSDSDTGIYRLTTGIGFSVGGAASFRVDGGSVRVSGGEPAYHIYENDAALNEKNWRIVAASGSLYFQGREDDGQTFANPTFMRFYRTAATATSVRFYTPLRNTDGNNATPSYSFTNDTDTGMYLSSTGTVAFASGGAIKAYVGANEFRVYHKIENADGTAADPAYSFNSDTNTGVYSAAADTIGFSTAGTARWSLNSTGQFVPATSGNYDIGTTSNLVRNIYSNEFRGENGLVSSPSFTFRTDLDTGMYLGSTGILKFSTAGADRLVVSGTTIENYTVGSGYGWQARYVSGTNNPGIFIENSETGNYSRLVQSSSPGNGALYLGVDSANTAILTTTQARFLDGSASAPSITFASDTNTGFYRPAADRFALTAGGSVYLSSELQNTYGYLKITEGAGGTVATLGTTSWSRTWYMGKNLRYNKTAATSSPYDRLNWEYISGDTGSNQMGSLLISGSNGTAAWDFYAVPITTGAGVIPASFTRICRIATNGTDSTGGQIQMTSGLDSAPSYSFSNDPDTGVYLPVSGSIGFATASTLRATIGSGQFSFGADWVDNTSTSVDQFQIGNLTGNWGILGRVGSGGSFYITAAESNTTKLSRLRLGSTGSLEDNLASTALNWSSTALTVYKDIVMSGNETHDIGSTTNRVDNLWTSAFYVKTEEASPIIDGIRDDGTIAASNTLLALRGRGDLGSGAAYGAQILFSADETWVQGTDSGGRITFQTTSNNTWNAATERMRIDHDGQVGIGETNPATLLHLSNSAGGNMLRLQDTGGAGNAANPYIDFRDSAATRLAYVGMGSTGNSILYINNDTVGGAIYAAFASSGTSGDFYLYNQGSTDTPTLYFSNVDGIKGYVRADDSGTTWLATNVPDASINLRDNGRSFNIATFDYNGTDTATINSVNNAVLALNTTSATGNPYLRFKQAGTDKARVQYVNGGQLRFRVEGNTDDFSFYAGGATAASDRRLNFNGLGDDLGRWGVENSQFYVEEDQTVLTVASTVTCDWDRSNQLHLTITNTVTIIAIDDDSMQPGGSYILMVQEGTSAPSSVTWDSTDTIFWANGTAPVLNGGDLNDITVVQFFKTTAGSNTRIIGSWFLAQ